MSRCTASLAVCSSSAFVLAVVVLGAAVVPVARRGVDGNAAESVTSRVAENILRRAADLACCGRRCRAIVATDRHGDLVPMRVGRNRMRAGGRCGVRVRAWGRSGILNSELGGAGTCKEIVIVAGIVPDFVGPTLARNDRDGAAIAIVHDQRIRAAAAERKLVIRTDRQARSSAATGRSGDRENFLDVERCMRRNPEGDAGAGGRRRPSRWDVEIEFSVPGIKYTLL